MFREQVDQTPSGHTREAPLIAQGCSNQLLAEVGTGKSTMAIYVAAALSLEHRGATARELEQLGHPVGE